jgi:hypothetical protein
MNISDAEKFELFHLTTVFPVARMAFAGKFDHEKITASEFKAALLQLGLTRENAFEMYVSKLPEEMALVHHCITKGHPRSAIVLLFTLFESELNTVARIHLRIRNYSLNAISSALKGTDFDTKMEVLLPLLGVEIAERLRNTALQCKAIRNLIVHNKATPSLWAVDDANQKSDEEIAEERSAKFFSENPIARIESDIATFVHDGINSSPAVKMASELIRKFYKDFD